MNNERILLLSCTLLFLVKKSLDLEYIQVVRGRLKDLEKDKKSFNINNVSVTLSIDFSAHHTI